MEKKEIKYDLRAYKLAYENTTYNSIGQAVIRKDDEWREETEWDTIFEQMCNTMRYRGYNGTIEYSEEGACYFGKVLGISDFISYEGNTMEDVEGDFTEAIDMYLKSVR